MKIHYYLMSMALAATALVGFTACDDDDPEYEPVYVVGGAEDPGNIDFTDADIRVKIGEANRVNLPVAGNPADYKAYSLDPSVAGVVEIDGVSMIEGYKNGSAKIMVSDPDGKYSTLNVAVYTTDVLTLNKSALSFIIPLGTSDSNDECAVSEGNGGYSIVSNNPKVTATITEEDGEITLSAKSGVDAYEAILTVTDCTGLTANITVTVEATFDPFTAAELLDIENKNINTLYGDVKDPSDDTYPYYYIYYQYYGYGTWYDGVYDDEYRLGWWYNKYLSGYGGLSMTYPSTAQVGEEVDGKFYFQYSNSAWYDLYTYEGKVKVLVDDASKTVAIFWQVDLENERINRGYIVHKKS